MSMICKFSDKSALFKTSEQSSLLRKLRVVFEAGRRTGPMINEVPVQAK